VPNGRFELGRSVVHFIFGAGLGAFIGLGVRAQFMSDGGWIAIPVAALGVGLLAAVFTDGFWEGFRDPDWRNHRGRWW
jgi:hypothetical protein